MNSARSRLTSTAISFLPAGAVSFATGVVYRREKGWR
jgi:hypothetical protein